MTNEIATIETENQISVMRDPEIVLKEAKKAAQALMQVVKLKDKPVIFNGAQYLEFEDWQTVAKFYGVTAKVTRTSFLDYGGVKGFEASADAVRFDGTVISSADAMCLNDEENWSTRAKYQWTDGKKEKVADVPVPLFQLRSMAQTRACSKALRNVLAWVVVLAGFKPTPAEEMTGNESGSPKISMPKAKVEETKAEDFRIMESKFDGKCKGCGGAVKKGEKIAYSKSAGTFHEPCMPSAKADPETIDVLADVQPTAVSEKEIETLKKLAATAGITEKKLLDVVGREGCESFDAMSRDLYNRLMKSIAKKIDEKAKDNA